MTLEKMRHSIIKDAEKKASEMESEASERAEQLIADAKKEAAYITKKEEEEAKAEAKRVEMEKKSDLENMANSLMNTAEAMAVSEAMEVVLPRLSKVLSDQNLDKMLKAGIKEMEKTTSEIVIMVNKKGASSLKGYTVKHREGDGFIIESKDGMIRLDATPSKIAEENSELARAEISSYMFGKNQAKSQHRTAKPVAKAKHKTAKHKHNSSKKKSRSKR